MDMKVGPVTKHEKKNTVMSKKFNDYITLANCDVMIFFPIFWTVWSHPEARF